jgi:hypothetical protein
MSSIKVVSALNRYRSNIKIDTSEKLQDYAEKGTRTLFDTLDPESPEVKMAKPSRFLPFFPMESRYCINLLKRGRKLCRNQDILPD